MSGLELQGAAIERCVADDIPACAHCTERVAPDDYEWNGEPHHLDCLPLIEVAESIIDAEFGKKVQVSTLQNARRIFTELAERAGRAAQKAGL